MLRPMRKAPYFSDWLQTQAAAPGPIGKLAKSGIGIPQTDNRKAIRRLVESLDKSGDLPKAFDVAWRTFRS